jgi:hypothetical protein
MATVLDLGLIKSFSFIFPWLLVFAFTYAILQKTKAIGDNIAINAIIAVVAAFTVLLSDAAVQVVNFVIPWFAIAIIFFVILLLFFMIFGHSESSIFDYIKNDKGVGWGIFVVALVIIIAGFGTVFGQGLTDLSFQGGETVVNTTISGGVGTPSHEQNVIATLFHPKVLGFVVIFVIAIFTVSLLTSETTK